MAEYKFTEDGQQCQVVSKIREGVWEVLMVYCVGEMDDPDDEMVFEEERSSIYHGNLHDFPPAPKMHFRIKELQDEIRDLERAESDLQRRIDALQTTQRMFQNPPSHVQGIGNVMKLISDGLPTHFVVVGDYGLPPKIVEYAQIYMVQDKIATLRVNPGRQGGNEIYWLVRLSYNDSGSEAIPCYSIEEATIELRKMVEVAAKRADISYYPQWKKVMDNLGITPHPEATKRYEAEQQRERDKKRIELENQIKSQQAALEKLK